MSSVITSFLLSLGACIWLYPKVYNRNGADNVKQTISMLVIAGLVIFVLLLLFLNIVF